MSYRRFPDRERALSQLDRHRHPTPPPSELQQQMATQARTALTVAGRAMQPVAEAINRMTINVRPSPMRTDPERSAVGVHISVIRAAEWRARNA